MRQIDFENYCCKFGLIINRAIKDFGGINLLLFLILSLITFYPLSFVKFTTHDDVVIALDSWNGNVWEITKHLSVGMGKFSLLWGEPLATIPYIYDNKFWYLTIKLGSFFAVISSLYYALTKLFETRLVANLSIILFISLIQNGWEHNLFTSYPFIFNFYLFLYLISLGLFAQALDQKKIVFSYIAGVAYFLSLASELFVFFFPFFIFVFVSRIPSGISLLRSIRSRKSYIYAILLPLIFYLIIYFIWRKIHPSVYTGNILNIFDYKAACKVILTYSFSAFPFVSVRFYNDITDPLLYRNIIGFYEFLSAINIVCLIKSVLIGILFARVLFQDHSNHSIKKILLIGAALAFIGIFLPNLLLGFTQRHQEWVSGGTWSYTYTYYSFISVVVFFAIIVSYVNVKSFSWNPKLRLVVLSIIIFTIMFVSLAVELRNQYIAFDQKLAHRKWQLMDMLINSPSFALIPDESIVYAPTLLNSQRGYAAVFAEDWSRYIKYKIGKNIKVVDDSDGCRSNEECYSIVFRQVQNLDKQFLLFNKIKKTDNAVLDDLNIFSIPIEDKVFILGAFKPSTEGAKIEINEKSIQNIGNGIFTDEITNTLVHGGILSAKITGNVNIEPEKISLTDYKFNPSLKLLSDEFRDGIDFKNTELPNFVKSISGLSTTESWGRWSDANLKPSVTIDLFDSLPDQFEFVLNAKAFGPNYGQDLKIKLGSQIHHFKLNVEQSTYRRIVKLEGKKIYSIELIPPQPTSPKQSGMSSDTRKLGVGLISLSIEN